MGSLMAGWDSNVPDPITAKSQRNLSLTKGEIEDYWRQNKNVEEEHLKTISDLPVGNQLPMIITEANVKMQRSSSLPPTKIKESFMDIEYETSLEDRIKQHSWWGRTNSAFLNEPPVIGAEGPTHKYASQYHVANMVASKHRLSNLKA